MPPGTVAPQGSTWQLSGPTNTFVSKCATMARDYGFPVRHEHEKPASIRKRVSALGGSFSVTTLPNGTELTIQVPLS